MPPNKALKEFQSGTGWHRGGEVDQLSKQEANIIAALNETVASGLRPVPNEK
ncbi:MAG: hypothetical protein L0Y58_12260 [Verrucomicrobia subdivision 3 bacterium]|nr:hypothetical protein [Limisphaerales bacterium]